VLIAYPENWEDGDRKHCFLGPPGGATVRKAAGQPDLPELDCDRLIEGEDIHTAAPERIFAREVTFDEGNFSRQLESRPTEVINEVPLTCQRKAAEIICTP
jgi:hypothetical protein